jgi:hypothetical protein
MSTILTNDNDIVFQLNEQLRLLEEKEYTESVRTRVVPPHYVIMNANSQADYDDLMRKNRNLEVLGNKFLTVPGDTFVKQGDNLLEVVNEQIFQKPWDKLELEYKINRLIVWVNSLDGILPQQREKLQRSLFKHCFKKCLNSHQVKYNSLNGEIEDIHGIDKNNTWDFVLEPEPVKITNVERITNITRNSNNTMEFTTKPIDLSKTSQSTPSGKPRIFIRNKK